MQELQNLDAMPTNLALAKAEVDCMISTAHAYPRNTDKAYKEALAMATCDDETAQSCIYSVPRAGKTIVGPSIRLAEMIAYAWGNLHLGVRVVDTSATYVTVEAVAWDLEKGNRYTSQEQRKITNKDNRRFSEDMVSVTAKAASAIALRNVIFKAIPKFYVDKIYKAAVNFSLGDLQSNKARKEKAIAYFQKSGILPERIYGYFGIANIDELRPEHMEYMIGISTAIKNGMAIEDAFNSDIQMDSGREINKADKLNEELMG